MKKRLILIVILLAACIALPVYAYDTSDSTKAGEKETINSLEKNISYEVQTGDTLYSIARKYKVTVQQLVKDNNIVDENYLITGRMLEISASGKPAEQVASDMSKIIDFIWPVKGVISSLFGDRNGKMHEGIDIALNMGAPIKAAQRGKVIFAGPRGTYGNAVILQHQDGYTTLYGHASEVLVSEGEEVEVGQVLAQTGSTGRSTGPHLHFEIRRNKIALDPIKILPKK